MEDKVEAVEQIEWSDFKNLKSTVNDEFSRLDEKRNTGQSIQKDLDEVFSQIYDLVYWQLVKAGLLKWPLDIRNNNEDPERSLRYALQMLYIVIDQQKQSADDRKGISVQAKNSISQMLNKIKGSIDSIPDDTTD